MRKWPGLNRNLPALLFSAALIALWELTCRKLTLPEYLLPAPSQIILALKKNYHLLMKHASATLHAVFAGLLLAVAVAMLLAVAMDRSPPLKKVLYPLLVVSQAIPIFALAPVIPVSYTHLDVYKRQPYLSPLAPLILSDLKDSIITVWWWGMRSRPKLLGGREPLRQPAGQKPQPGQDPGEGERK